MIVAIIIVGVGIGYSVGMENGTQLDVSDEIEQIPVSQGRNITIELNDGINFSATP